MKPLFVSSVELSRKPVLYLVDKASRRLATQGLVLLLVVAYTASLLRLHHRLDKTVPVVPNLLQQAASDAVAHQQPLTLSRNETFASRPEPGPASGPPMGPLDGRPLTQPSAHYVIDPDDWWERVSHNNLYSAYHPFSVSSGGASRPTNNEEEDLRLPIWMKSYFRWHKEQRSVLTQENWNGTIDSSEQSPERRKYLVLMCLPGMAKCGGAADRLLPLPFFVRVAAQSHRLLFIKWGRPAELESFLLPPVGGFDWRLPRWLLPKVKDAGAFVITEDTILTQVALKNLTVVRARLQSDDHGAVYYDSRIDYQPQNHESPVGEPTFREVYRDVWRTFFTPVPAVAQRVSQYLERSGLQPHHYIGVHLRALYGVPARDSRTLQQWTEAAINCSSFLSDRTVPRPADMFDEDGDPLQVHDGPLFFASDTSQATTIASEYGSRLGALVVTNRKRSTGGPNAPAEPLHLDKATQWQQREVSDFYDIFVDAYLLSLARCVAYSVGGYGKWGSLMTQNASCSMRYGLNSKERQCSFVQVYPRFNYDPIPQPMLPPPMPLKEADQIAVVQSSGPIVQTSSSLMELSGHRQLHSTKERVFPNPRRAASSGFLWEESTLLPLWMKEYFEWHRDQRHKMELATTETEKSQFRFLVVTCLESAPKCGGTADRLRPIPFYVRVASETNRILLVRWERPAPLESFLLPPTDGVDWRVPHWLVDVVRHNAEPSVVTTVKGMLGIAGGDDTIVRARLQAHDHGSDYYNEKAVAMGEPKDAFRQHYRDCWYTLFTPVAAISSRIESELRRTKLIPGQYAFAHLRAYYGVEGSSVAGSGDRSHALIEKWTRNAINCVSRLRPGGPYFFSSDSAYARHVAVEYGMQRNVSIAVRTEMSTRNDDEEAIHLDLVADWKSREPSEYYDIFVDLYLMSMGRCMSYNVGGKSPLAVCQTRPKRSGSRRHPVSLILISVLLSQMTWISGYGKWAQHLSGQNLTCNNRYWTNGVGKGTADPNGCEWVEPGSPSLGVAAPVAQHPLFLTPMVEGMAAEIH
jgi:hypothetical protein